MGTGKLQIWITSESDPCRISERDEHDNLPWVVGIWHCNGQLLNWCGRKYFGMEARCGHLEVDLPPGCYVVRAADWMGLTHQGVWGNHWTDHGVVTVCCDQTTCVTLFAPSAHNCGVGFLGAVRRMIAEKRLPAKIGEDVAQLVQAVVNRAPKTEFDIAALPAMAALLQQAGQEQKPDDCD